MARRKMTRQGHWLVVVAASLWAWVMLFSILWPDVPLTAWLLLWLGAALLAWTVANRPKNG